MMMKLKMQLIKRVRVAYLHIYPVIGKVIRSEMFLHHPEHKILAYGGGGYVTLSKWVEGMSQISLIFVAMLPYIVCSLSRLIRPTRRMEVEVF